MMDSKEREELEEVEEATNSFIYKLCEFIVDKRNLFFLIFGLLAIASIITKNWVKVENSLSAYLPQSTETRRGLDLMDEQFVTYGSCTVMVANISYEQGEAIADDIRDMKGVFSVDYADDRDHYNNGSAKFGITFNYSEKNDKCLVCLDKVKDYFEGYDYYLDTSLGDISAELIDDEMKVISVIVVIIVLSVLFFTTEAYAEIPVLLITFGAAAVLQMGSNFIFGTISFVSDSVTIVLQLALSIDYAIIFMNRYKEEHLLLETREAVIVALTKAIPEISGSSLTTMGGLLAMTFMQYKMGPDMGIVLIKAIVISLLSVFLLMPGIIMIFAKWVEKTKHKNFIPKISVVGKIDYVTRFFVVPVFVLLIVGACLFSKKCNYVFGYTTIKAPIENYVQIAENMINGSFESENVVALIVPSGDYEKEKQLIDELEACREVKSCTGLANTEAMNGYTLTAALTPRQFSELTDLDYEVAEVVYTAYAIHDEDYAKTINGLSDYRVPLIDMFMFVHDEVEDGYVTLDSDVKETLDDAFKMMNFAKKQLQGEDYSRILVNLNLPEESEETFEFIDKMRSMASDEFGKAICCGECVSDYDLQKTFALDNVVVSAVSIVAVLVVLLFTFKSAGLPILLIAVIQGSIWINFCFPPIQHQNIFFLSYLIVTSIQMGANIDYAIVIASRYTELRKTMNKKDAITDTLNLSFPTIITSGPMLALAGITIGSLTSDAAIYNIGQCIGRGTIISIFITLFVLPQILLVGDTIIEKTAFVMKMPHRVKSESGVMRVDGVVRGRINGTLVGTVHGVIKGDVKAFVDMGKIDTDVDIDESVFEEFENNASMKGGETNEK